MKRFHPVDRCERSIGAQRKKFENSEFHECTSEVQRRYPGVVLGIEILALGQNAPHASSYMFRNRRVEVFLAENVDRGSGGSIRLIDVQALVCKKIHDIWRSEHGGISCFLRNQLPAGPFRVP